MNYGYVRYSPTAKKQGASLQVQCEKIVANDPAVGYIFSDEAKSGKNLERPGLREMLAHVKRGDTVTITSLSRLSRSVMDTETITSALDKRGVGLVIMDMGVNTSTPMGKLFLQITAAYAEFERKMIAERTSDAMRVHQSNGRSISSQAPYGWVKVGKRLEIDEVEQKWIGKMMAWRAEPNPVGYKKIAGLLEVYGAPSRGNHWHRETVRRILERDPITIGGQDAE